MNLFDVVGILSKVPFDLVQKIESDLSKIERLIALSQQVLPQLEEAAKIWETISPDVANLLKAIGEK